jgi:hypothetical protein
MRIDRSLQRSFPTLAAWIADEIPKARQQPRIWDAFLHFSQLGPEQAAAALMLDASAPTIDVDVERSYGSFRPRRNRDKIFISRRLCRQFERQDPDRRIVKPWDLIMKATILHEMIHWADYKDGTQQPDRTIEDPATGRKWVGADVGFQFEAQAFYGIYTREYL